MASPKFIQSQSFTIQASGASAGDTTLTLQSFKLIDGVTNIVTANLGDQCYGTLEPNNGTQEESIQFTGVTQNAGGTATLTGVSTVGFVYPYTVSSGLAKSHSGGVTFVISNDAGLYGNLVTYINNTAASGAALASSTINGLTKLSVDPASPSSPIAVGVNNSYSTTAISNTNPVVDKAALSMTTASGAVVQANGSGLINSNFISFPSLASYLSLVASGQTSYTLSTASGNQNIAHGLGVAPRYVKITAYNNNYVSGAAFGMSVTTYVASTQASQYFMPAANVIGTDFRGGIDNSNYASGAITVDATNIKIAWTKAGSPTGTLYMLWEAIA